MGTIEHPHLVEIPHHRRIPQTLITEHPLDPLRRIANGESRMAVLRMST